MSRHHLPRFILKFSLGLIFAAVFAAATATAQSRVEVQQDARAYARIGKSAQILHETRGKPLTLKEAESAYAKGLFSASKDDVPNFGHLAPPTWIHLSIHNAETAAPYRIYVAQGWTGRLEAWLRRPDGSVQTWHAGLRELPAKDLRPGVGFGFDTELQTGTSELFIRVNSNASAALDMRVVPMPLTAAMESRAEAWNGSVHGFLLALILTYALLWAALKDKAQGRYVLYVTMYLFMHVGYSGVGSLWLWPNDSHVARAMILSGMALFASSGLWFSREFLDSRSWAPKLDFKLKWMTRIVLTFMGTVIAFDFDRIALLLSFPFLMLFTLLEVCLGILAVRKKRDLAGIFLIASSCRLTGLVITSQAVVGRIPFNDYTFRAVEIGVLIEATLWAMALGLRLRRDRIDHVTAMRLAQSDPLTGLFNRRGFLNVAKPKIEHCQKMGLPVALIMADLDHFKTVNDIHGHEAGDAVLIEAAQRFKGAARSADVVCRWGGEEFLILMCGMSRENAIDFAERLRAVLAEKPIVLPDKQLANLTTSVGVVVDSESQHALEDLLHYVDAALYSAKEAGRDCVIKSTL
ncbi:GGDEF domain-containing protein [Lysobacter sp. HDW10]|uniref:sensor domain-containing diguanylate cyclase n=1 Tax=Lysobacter sp. HDW10 TaxID=2714936 RepID=UPI00140C5628|nr:diguanylate cyclase [Lysobacter sp. HDW10]QIK81808.1 GGDEF domain-containing protein [Lysobacter sp. HDW10]